MSFAIFRVQKLKSYAAISRSGKHTDRTQTTPNADLQVANIELPLNEKDLDIAKYVRGKLESVETEPEMKLSAAFRNAEGLTLGALVKAKIGDIKHRQDAILSTEFFCGTSPEHFRPDAPERAGYYQQERVVEWVELNFQWLKAKFGDNLIKATVHLDEATPHIVAYAVPLHSDLTSGEQKLSYNLTFGGSKHRLSEWQDDYARAMSSLGLRRGKKRDKDDEKGDHKDIDNYYRDMNAANRDAARLREQVETELELPELEPGETGAAYHERLATIMQTQKVAVTELLRPVVVKATATETANQAKRAAQAELETLTETANQAKHAAQVELETLQTHLATLEQQINHQADDLKLADAAHQQAIAAELLAITEFVLTARKVNRFHDPKSGFTLSRRRGFTKISKDKRRLAHNANGQITLTEHWQQEHTELLRQARQLYSVQTEQEVEAKENKSKQAKGGGR